VKPLLRASKQVRIKAAVHITGDSYLKFNNLVNFSPGIGFRFTKFDPHPIFHLIQETARQMKLIITDEEMFRTFNMGWGFAVIVDPADAKNALAVLEKTGCHSEAIGEVTDNKRIEIEYNNKKILLS
jgi:phosphoribosylformylglycinamidine cyclo-ligase